MKEKGLRAAYRFESGRGDGNRYLSMRARACPAATGIRLTDALQNSRALWSGLAFAVLSVTIFSGWFVVTRFSVTHNLRVWDTTALRFGIGAVLLSPVLVGKRRGLPRSAWLEGLLFAGLWGAPFVLLVSHGLQLTSAALAASIAPTLMPVFSGLIAWLVSHRSPGRMRLLGYIAIIAGLMGLGFVDASFNGPPSPSGITSLILAAAMWAAYALRFDRSQLSPLQAALICFWSALLFLPAYLLLGLSHLGEASLQEIAWQAGYQGILMTVVAIASFNRAVALLGAGAATAIIALLPVMASVLAVPVLNEVPTAAGLGAIVVIAGGVMLAAWPGPSHMST